MGSRAVLMVCRTPEAARRRFRIDAETPGAIYTRTGRAFFNEPAMERAMLARAAAAAEAVGLWEELGTDWLCLDAEIMPWSAKAQALITQQYAPVGAAARASLGAASEAFAQAAARGVEGAEAAAGRMAARAGQAGRYRAAWRRYCWPAPRLEDHKIAPFHLLASEGAAHFDKDHLWHLERLDRLCAADSGIFRRTDRRVAALEDAAALEEATEWWLALTRAGGEGMVVKPLEFTRRGPRGLVQPGVKCRGPEYLRIIYGPEYDAPEHLERLKRRGLARKRALALREYALGHEAMARFAAGAPLHRVHECVFGVLALESEPVDPRL